MYKAETIIINCIFQAKKALITGISERRMSFEKRNIITKSKIQMNVAISLDLNKGSISVDKKYDFYSVGNVFNQQMTANVPASMWSLASCAGLKRLFMLAIVGTRFSIFKNV